MGTEMLSNGILLEFFNNKPLKMTQCLLMLNNDIFGITATRLVSHNKVSVHVHISLSLYIFALQVE